MDQHLQAHIQALFEQHHRATLATCGAAGPQVSVITYQTHDRTLHLLLPQTSDHLFNLNGQPDLVLLTPTWKLHGRGTQSHNLPLSSSWQAALTITPIRLHILSSDGQQSVETIDF